MSFGNVETSTNGFNYFFADLTNLKSIKDVDLSSVSHTGGMFDNCSSLISYNGEIVIDNLSMNIYRATTPKFTNITKEMCKWLLNKTSTSESCKTIVDEKSYTSCTDIFDYLDGYAIDSLHNITFTDIE